MENILKRYYKKKLLENENHRKCYNNMYLVVDTSSNNDLYMDGRLRYYAVFSLMFSYPLYSKAIYT